MITDCNIKQLKSFETFLGRDDKLTEIFLKEMKFSLEGPFVGNTWRLGKTPNVLHDKSWFMEALKSIVVRPGIVTNTRAIPEEESITTVANCYDSPDDCGGGGFDRYDSNENDGEYDDEDRAKVGNAYPILASRLGRITDLIEDMSDLSIVNRAFDTAYEELLRKKRSKVPNGTIRSLPEISNSRKRRRNAPVGSPSRKGASI
jgi:hypothetical protein